MNPIIKHLSELVAEKPYKLFGVSECILNNSFFYYQESIIRELWAKPYPLLACKPESSKEKSYILASYAMLRALLCPGSIIVVTASSFRQSKNVFKACEEIWDGSPVLWHLITEGGPRRDIDRCSVRLGDSQIFCIPVGNSDRLRGFRATHIIVDDFDTLPKDIFESVVLSSATISGDKKTQVVLAGCEYEQGNSMSPYIETYRRILNRGDISEYPGINRDDYYLARF